MKTTNKTTLTLIIIMFTGLVAFSQQEADSKKKSEILMAECKLNPTAGNICEGTVTFTKVDGGVKVEVKMKGLSPGKHGFHIHEFGDCSAPDATSAGGHFNPEMKEHGGPMDHMRHEGDMGNITADMAGNATLEYIDPHMKLDGKESIIGKSVIVHQNEDDLKTQPTGNAGPRIACGVIEVGGC